MFVASSGSESNSDVDTTTRTVARRRLRQDTQPVRAKRRFSAVDDDASGTNRRAPTVIVLDSDSDASDSNAAPEAAAVATQRSAADGATSEQQLQWECAKCTFLNDSVNSLCEICTSPCPTRTLRNMAQWLAPAAKPAKRAQPAAAAAPPTTRKLVREPLTEAIDSSGGSDADERHRAVPSRASANSLHSQRFRTPARTTATSGALWADAYAPSSVDELCVNKKKVTELAEWLTQATALPATAPASVHPRKRLLFLCGPPGCGKSTAVRCIAKRMHVEIKEWSDNSSAGKLSYERMLSEQFWTQQTSNADDFVDFITRSVTYAALPVATVAPMRKRRLASRAAAVTPPPMSSAGQVILIESWPQSWSKLDAAWDDRVQRIFRLIVDRAARTQFPVICIFSDVRESKIDLKHLAKLFSADVMNSPFTTVMTFNSVTAAQVKKHVVRIADAERCSLSTAEIQQVVDKSSGDIRHAINTLQLVARGGGSDATNESDDERAARRDSFLSDFHVVGKILHGKIAKSSEPKATGAGSSSSKRVDFDQMVDVSAMSLDKVLELVHANCVDYFTDVEDLSNAFELLSATETMLAESYKGNANTEVFKRIRDVAQAILVRSIALTNDHPAPSAFRPITGARSFVTRQRVAWKRDEMLQFTAASHDSNYHYLCSGDTFAFDVEPYLGVIGNRAHAPQMAISSHSGHGAADGEVDDEIESSDGGW